MKTKKEQLNKKLFTWSLVAIALLAAFSIKLFLDGSKTRSKLSVVVAENDSLKNRVEFLGSKSEADELFIAGAHDSAFAVYHKLFGPEDEIGFFEQRRKFKEQIETEKQEAKNKLLASMNELNLLEKTLKLQLLISEEKQQNIQDSIKNSLKKQISELSVKVAQKEEELKKMPVMQKLSFTNNKGSKIKYFGELKAQMANGQGIGLWNTGSVYEGEWANNSRHGLGKYEWPDGEKYEGEYAHDKRNGHGTYFWKNGDRYVGSWKEDKRNGQGIVYDKDGNIKLKGEWKDDELTGAGRNGS